MEFEKNYGKNFVALFLITGLFIAGCVDVTPPEGEAEIARFASCNAIGEAFKASQARGYYGYYDILSMPLAMIGAKGIPETVGPSAAETPDYSKTNIQVEGVDEADIVKTDGKYIYLISKGNLVIARAWPGEEAKVLSVTSLGEKTSLDLPSEMFIENDAVLIFGNRYEDIYPENAGEMEMPYYPGRNFTVLQLWNVVDRENPVLERTVDFEGSYLTSRKIGDTAYFVIRSLPVYYILENEEFDETIVPKYRETNSEEEAEFEPMCGCVDIGYFDQEIANAFVTIGSISMSDFEAEVEKETVVGYGENVYASQQNLYLAEVSYQYLPRVGFPMPSIETVQTTNVHKFGLSEGEISYLGSGEAPGRILNQFSMDEHNGYFRIATTIGHVSIMGDSHSTNNVYIFDSELKMVGKLEDLAPGEKIYSARFMGEKGYLVTFKKIDPLFVIDLSEPTKPKVLGKLKIPGYSDYLHPYDETHIIGIGKETVEAEEGDFAWYQGIKIALFDVSNVENPKELHKVVIGDRRTDSYALHDHKAFLFDREKELLVIPILLAEIEGEKFDERNMPQWGDFVFQGAYVYNLSLENGFELKGRVTHVDDEEVFKKAGYYYYDNGHSVKRSLYIGDILYTISDNKILLNALADLELVNELKIFE